VRGRTLGIVGYGHIGSQVSVLAEAMGMRVIYHDIVPKLPMGNARSVRTLAELLKEADAVTLHVPATGATANLIGGKQLKLMKPGAVLINNARGSVVDVEALAEALRSGHLAGAALDVFPHEPAAKGEGFESPLRGLPGVILTPHVGGSTEEAQETIAADVAESSSAVNIGSTTGRQRAGKLPEQTATAGPPHTHRILHFHRTSPACSARCTDHRRGQCQHLGGYLRTSEDIGYVVLDADPTDATKVMESLKQVPETIRVRMLW
jgi:D-3-phosphoglycerate dehydrogenase